MTVNKLEEERTMDPLEFEEISTVSRFNVPSESTVSIFPSVVEVVLTLEFVIDTFELITLINWDRYAVSEIDRLVKVVVPVLSVRERKREDREDEERERLRRVGESQWERDRMGI